jgi:hypothetical protein
MNFQLGATCQLRLARCDGTIKVSSLLRVQWSQEPVSKHNMVLHLMKHNRPETQASGKGLTTSYVANLSIDQLENCYAVLPPVFALCPEDVSC